MGDRKQQLIEGITVRGSDIETNDRLPAGQWFNNQTKALDGLQHTRRVERTFALA